jgi:hypothetical protein
MPNDEFVGPTVRVGSYGTVRDGACGAVCYRTACGSYGTIPVGLAVAVVWEADTPYKRVATRISGTWRRSYPVSHDAPQSCFCR